MVMFYNMEICFVYRFVVYQRVINKKRGNKVYLFPLNLLL
nr:MAG TPA: hypothetical protein [Caudoviricetes sp.]